MMTHIINTTISNRVPRELRKRIEEAKRVNNITSNQRPDSILTIIACHTDTFAKVNAVLTNISKLRFPANKVVVVNSSNAKYSYKLKTCMHRFPAVEYYEIPNSMRLDIGKWMYYLQHHYQKNYSYVVFTNDSYLLTSPIYHFFNMMLRSGVHLYGYNDSSQIKYHYQSYLFGVKADAVPILINHYNTVYAKLTDYMSVVNNIELRLVEIFPTKDCFLKLARLPGHENQNIFFTNDALYNILMKEGVMPIYKMKRLYSTPDTLAQPVLGNSYSQRGALLNSLMPARFGIQ